MTKRTLGISLYPDHSDFEQDRAYLDISAQAGFTRLFVSMLEVQDSKAHVTEKYQRLIQHAHQLGFKTTLDVAPNIFDQLGVSYQDLSYFASLGADALRLDAGFDGHEEAWMSYNPPGLDLELNMSNDVEYLPNILTYGANQPFLYGCHNFYPQRGTGLPLDFFIACSQRFKRAGIETAAFVTAPGATIGPWDINDGLPTLEMHRDWPLVVQVQHLFSTGLIDSAIIGNAYASQTDLQQLGRLNRYHLTFTVTPTAASHLVERQILLDNLHERRGDINDLTIRSTAVRKRYHDANPVNEDRHTFQRGDVVIGNDQFGKYQNELQIVLQPHQDQRKNLVATIAPDQLVLLDAVGPWAKFAFVATD
ncbi:DUF871 domain-containing protein [Lactiplantibacillus pentosus]